MQMVSLHRKVHNAKPRSRRPPEGPPDHLEHDFPAKARQTRAPTQSDVNRVGLWVHGTHAMRQALSKPRGLSPRAGAPSASRSKLELLLSPRFHVIGLLVCNY